MLRPIWARRVRTRRRQQELSLAIAAQHLETRVMLSADLAATAMAEIDLTISEATVDPDSYVITPLAGPQADVRIPREFAPVDQPELTSPGAFPSGGTQLIAGSESEPNNTPGTATPVPGFGTGPGDDPEADLTLTQGGITLDGTTSISSSGPIGDVGDSIGDALPISSTLLSAGELVGLVGQTLGDGSFGGTSGDFDFYEVPMLAGQQLYVEVDTDDGLGFGTGSFLEPVLGIYDSSGTLMYHNDEQFVAIFAGSLFDNTGIFVAPADGSYYFAVGGWSLPGTPQVLPSDPTTAGTGPGAGSTGTYDLLVGLDMGDQDFFSVDLEAGDVLTAGLTSGFGIVSIRNPDGSEAIGSFSDATGIFPTSSPLQAVSGTRNATLVAPVSGTYTIGASFVDGAGTLELRAFRPELETQPVGAAQYLFLDFDGATIDAAATFGSGGTSASLSPLSSFLDEWDLTGGDEDAVIDAIIASVEESLSADLRVVGNNGDFATSGVHGEMDIQVLNSRDHADLFGVAANFSRMIIGGTIAELGISTIGIAQSIDPGNFDTSETAVVLLDLLSDSPLNPNSLNGIPLDPSVDMIDLIGTAVGNIVAHEAGHYLGSFHTDQFFTPGAIMDQGGNLANTIGLGPDGTFGSGDDVDVDFTSDILVPEEGLLGREDTINTTAFGLSTGTASGAFLDLVSGELFITGDDDAGTGDTIEVSLDLSGDIEVMLDGGSLGPFDPADVTSIIINGRAGDDIISVAPFAGIPVEIDGGDPPFPNGGVGDELTVDATGVTAANFTDNGDGSGSLMSGSHASITWIDIEEATPLGVTAPMLMDTSINAGAVNRSGINTLTLQFDAPVTIGDPADLVLFNHTTEAAVVVTGATLSGNGTTAVTWNFNDFDLPDGQYTAELSASAATPNLAQTSAFAFGKLRGDVNGNGRVDINDLNPISANWLDEGDHFIDGDANGNGRVDINDLNPISANWLAEPEELSLDFGDAPEEIDTSFPTTSDNNGARHVITGNTLRLGPLRDGEDNGQPGTDATGDDILDDADEDGILFLDDLVPGTDVDLTVASNGAGFLNAWIDYNQDEDWDDPGEQIFTDEPLVPGDNDLSIAVPGSAMLGETFARFRLTGTAGYSYFGLAPDGEVEDYQLTIEENLAALTLTGTGPESFTATPVQTIGELPDRLMAIPAPAFTTFASPLASFASTPRSRGRGR